MTTGMDLKLQRIAANVKQKDVAAAAGWHPGTVNRLEKRAIVLPADVAKYTAALATLATKTTEEAAA